MSMVRDSSPPSRYLYIDLWSGPMGNLRLKGASSGRILPVSSDVPSQAAPDAYRQHP